MVEQQLATFQILVWHKLPWKRKGWREENVVTWYSVFLEPSGYCLVAAFAGEHGVVGAEFTGDDILLDHRTRVQTLLLSPPTPKTGTGHYFYLNSPGVLIHCNIRTGLMRPPTSEFHICWNSSRNAIQVSQQKVTGFCKMLLPRDLRSCWRKSGDEQTHVFLPTPSAESEMDPITVNQMHLISWLFNINLSWKPQRLWIGKASRIRTFSVVSTKKPQAYFGESGRKRFCGDPGVGLQALDTILKACPANLTWTLNCRQNCICEDS